MAKFKCGKCDHTWIPRAQRMGSSARQQRCSECGSRSVTMLLTEIPKPGPERKEDPIFRAHNQEEKP